MKFLLRSASLCCVQPRDIRMIGGGQRPPKAEVTGSNPVGRATSFISFNDISHLGFDTLAGCATGVKNPCAFRAGFWPPSN